MPNLPLPQLFLSAAIVSFIAFGVTLFWVSIWSTWLPQKARTAAPRAVTPAKRAPVHSHA
jgi:hypothetical protein